MHGKGALLPAAFTPGVSTCAYSCGSASPAHGSRIVCLVNSFSSAPFIFFKNIYRLLDQPGFIDLVLQNKQPILYYLISPPPLQCIRCSRVLIYRLSFRLPVTCPRNKNRPAYLLGFVPMGECLGTLFCQGHDRGYLLLL